MDGLYVGFKYKNHMTSANRCALVAALFHVFFVLCAPLSHAIILGDRPLVVEVAKSGDGGVEFDILNLAKIIGPEKTGNWIKKLQEDTEGARIHYSNSIHLRIGKGFTNDEVQWICDMLVACKVYLLSVTVLTEERREVFEHKMNPSNMMKIIRQRRIEKEAEPIPKPSQPTKNR